MYLLLRYHNFLCQRLLYIYRYSEKQIFKQQDSAVKRAKAAMSAEYNPITSRLQGSEPVADVLCLRRKLDIDVRDYYVAFIDQVKKLLDSNIDQDQYEDNLRDMFSTRAYHMFTINKIIVHAVKHLQQVCQDSQKLLECHKTFRRELSGEMRSTPNVTNEVLNNAELMDSTKEQGVTLWHEWPTPESRMSDREYENMCKRYQQCCLDNCSKNGSTCFKVIVNLTLNGELTVNITQLPVASISKEASDDETTLDPQQEDGSTAQNGINVQQSKNASSTKPVSKSGSPKPDGRKNNNFTNKQQGGNKIGDKNGQNGQNSKNGQNGQNNTHQSNNINIIGESMEDSEDEGEEEVIDPEEFDASMMDENNQAGGNNHVEINNERSVGKLESDDSEDEHNVPSLTNKNGNNEQPEDTALPTEDSPNPV